MNYNRRYVFFSACLGMLLFGITLITLGAVAPALKAKFSLDEIEAGTLFSILPIGILMGSLLFGPLADKYGFKFLLAFSSLCLFIGFQGIAYAPSYHWIKVFVFLFGLGGGAVNGATNAVVADISTSNKAADLSLLGVFFAIGALGMPFILGILNEIYAFETIVSMVGGLALLAAVIYFIIGFPPPKLKEKPTGAKNWSMIKDTVLWLIAAFLFFQSSMEGIINNWTTLFLIEELAANQSNALYALSLYVVGMAVMRILIGSVLRPLSSQKILFLSFALLLLGCGFMGFGTGFPTVVIGLILIGAGLAAGYPVMLGFVSDRYTELSGTAFSFVLAVALIGNMSVNYLMGFVADRFGVANLPTVAFCIVVLMMVLSNPILNNTNKVNTNKDDYASKTMAQ
ncbi:MFS transporter [Negadavirga shengliensis]|uniref:MFS transporter n=1 Tax=Negadavirga shengliensis TaxID=1389218 RepID=A0ABV9T0R0_9BACT